jgi:hypothetical protein
VSYETDNNQGSIYSWSITGGIQSGGGTSSEITVDWGNEGVGIVSVQETNRFGCVSPTNTIQVEKTYDLPELEIFGDSSICEFVINNFYEVVGTSGSAYHWEITGGNQVGGDSLNTISVNWLNAGPASVAVRQIAYDLVNNRVCSSPVSVLDVVNSECYILAANAGGIPEMIPESFHKKVLSQLNTDDLASAMHNYIAMPADKRRLLAKELLMAMKEEQDIINNNQFTFIDTESIIEIEKYKT